MDIHSCKEDLTFFYSRLLDHPLFITKPEEKTEFARMYHEFLERTDDLTGLIDAMTRLTAFFSDGHTNIELPYSQQDKCLNIPCDWQNDRLVLTERYKDIPAGSEILSIENISAADLIPLMAKQIPHENIYLVKSRMTSYPYKNYHLFSQRNLERLFDRKPYEIVFSVSRQHCKRLCPLEHYNGFLRFADETDFISYEIGPDAVTLHLDACICNDRYKDTLRFLAELCAEKNVRTFILDLSRNMGGSSAVIDEFIRYTDTDRFRRYEMIDYSSGDAKYITRRTDVVQNKVSPGGAKNAACLPPELYCRISQHTFSSARTFAVTLNDNGIAKIVGTPSGGKPSSFGLPRRYKTPHSGISFRVSSCMFLRPDSRCDSDISLFPDVPAPV